MWWKVHVSLSMVSYCSFCVAGRALRSPVGRRRVGAGRGARESLDATTFFPARTSASAPLFTPPPHRVFFCPISIDGRLVSRLCLHDAFYPMY